MTCTAAMSSPPLLRPWPEHLLRRLGDRLHGLADAAQSRREVRVQARGFENLCGLSEHTLRDIGVPDRLLARAKSFRAFEQQRLQALNSGLW